MIERNINRIRSINTSKKHENFESVLHSKHFPGPDRNFDALLREVLDKASREIDCTRCANCCKEIQPLFSENDIKRFVRGFDLTEGEFKKVHLTYIEERSGYYFNAKPCPFLKENKCTNYENRPQDCRSYPHLNSKEQIYRMLKTDYRHSACPVVRNVCERFEEHLW